MLVELAFFPMSMGYIVDLCALPLFPAGTWSSRLAVQQRHPLLSFFAHWLCGTLFMCVHGFCVEEGRALITSKFAGSPLPSSSPPAVPFVAAGQCT